MIEPEDNYFPEMKKRLRLFMKKVTRLVGYVAIQLMILLSTNSIFVLFRTIVEQST